MIIHEMAIYAISAAIDRRLRAFLIADSATNRNAIAASPKADIGRKSW
jgi:hypothetical protein